ncbi:MAG: hypothetical protein RRB13_09370 [bacterium]|nr:hypothetical protein [bacterium]
MSRLFLYNYDFEFELAGLPHEPVQGRKPWYFLNRQALLLWPLLSEGDALAVYQIPPDEVTGPLKERLGFLPQWVLVQGKETNRIGLDLLGQQAQLAEFELIPWGWSPSLEQLAGAPPSLMAARGNSKLFGHQLRPPEFAPQAAIIDEVDLLEDMLNQARADWGPLLVKHPWGSSGRLSERLEGPASAKQLERWALWINECGGLLVEKRMELSAEWSLQYDLAPTGPRLIGVTRLYTDSNGAHRANALGQQPSEAIKPMLSGAEAMVRIFWSEGFRGPLGLDVLESAGRFFLGEVNLRLTMGRLALEWGRALGIAGRLEVGSQEGSSGAQLINRVSTPDGSKIWWTYFYPN